MIKIILADDHDLVRTGIRRILEDESEFSVIAEAKNGEEAVQLCRKNAPDVVLMDVNMPGIGGLEATKRIVRMSENTRVVCVSMVKESPIPMQVMNAGAFGFLTKDAEPEEVIRAIYKWPQVKSISITKLLIALRLTNYLQVQKTRLMNFLPVNSVLH